ncbi:beta-propeller fold lactonase family protein, partial [Streptococcus pneumoniae]
AVHHDSDNATVFKRNCDHGRLAELSTYFHVPEAVCIRFAPYYSSKISSNRASFAFSYRCY